MIDDEQLRELAERLTGVPGVAGVLLGGSRARGEHTPDSDVDLGLYYRHPLDVVALGDLARDVAGDGARVTRPGEWGRGSTAAAGSILRGRRWTGSTVTSTASTPPGSTHGQAATASTPRSGTRWGCPTSRKAVTRADTTYVAGCLFRVVEVCAHALHGHAGHWLINEKGAVASAARLPDAPASFARRAQRILAHLGAVSDELSTAIDAAADLLADTITSCQSAL